MGVVSVLSLSIPFPPRRRRVFPPKLRSPGSFFVTKPVSIELPPPGPSRKSYPPCSSNGEESEESLFLDEDGVVDDIDGYLNYLSLEYDSVWDTKPSWCQPWTILLTGVIVVSCSWLFLHSLIITAGVLSLICAWWYIFLYSYPKVLRRIFEIPRISSLDFLLRSRKLA
ncbi:uncharacterized protein [Elaeis guineensis]|uniref:uncharacterized protein isoform X2 n=1 Tax=Elaeis guineensis var. tenera TaxID=51953 RepID=UPI003C6D14AC